jgi:hypothetical protein
MCLGFLLCLFTYYDGRPFALLIFTILSFMSFGACVEMKMYIDEAADEGTYGSIAIVTLMSICSIFLY